MTACSTMPLAAEITARLEHALAPSHLEVINDSHRHAGHFGDNGTGESHFTVVVESIAFAGLTRIARQRLVNHALADLLVTRVHALAIKACAPGEA